MKTLPQNKRDGYLKRFCKWLHKISKIGQLQQSKYNRNSFIHKLCDYFNYSLEDITDDLFDDAYYTLLDFSEELTAFIKPYYDSRNTDILLPELQELVKRKPREYKKLFNCHMVDVDEIFIKDIADKIINIALNKQMIYSIPYFEELDSIEYNDRNLMKIKRAISIPYMSSTSVKDVVTELYNEYEESLGIYWSYSEGTVVSGNSSDGMTIMMVGYVDIDSIDIVGTVDSNRHNSYEKEIRLKKDSVIELGELEVYDNYSNNVLGKIHFRNRLLCKA